MDGYDVLIEYDLAESGGDELGSIDPFELDKCPSDQKRGRIMHLL